MIGPQHLQPARLPILALVAALTFAIAATLAPPVHAQSQDEVRGMSQRLERLQREVNDLQRIVFRGDTPDPSEAPQVPATSGAGEPVGLTREGGLRLQQRLEALEQEVRKLTGQIEETRFELRRMADRFETFEADTNLRLSDLEQGRPAGQAEGASTSRTRADTETPETPATAGATGGAATGGDAVAGREPRSLGQVSEDAVASLREDQAREREAETQTAAAPAEDVLPDAAPEEQYRHAFGLLRQTEYGEAERALQAFLDRHGDHDLAGNAQYWLGETFYVRGNYNRAAVNFAEGFQKYPDSSKAPDNLLKLGMSLSEIERVEDACGIFAELQNRYPQAPSNILQRAEREEQRLDCSS